MTVKAPSAVLGFNAVPDDAGDADVKVYVNGELVESGGGGGDSDFSIIKMSLSNDPSIIHDGLRTTAPIVTNSGIVVDPYTSIQGNATYDVAAYKGNVTFLMEYTTVMVSGHAVFDAEEGVLTANGDFTIVQVVE